MAANVTYLSGPRIERPIGRDRRQTGEEKIVLAVAYGQYQTTYLVELDERDLLHIASGAINMLDHLRRQRENQER